MRKIQRCRWDKKIGGVCGGLGQYFQIDPALIRFVLICTACLTAFLPLAVIYLIAWMLIPEGPSVYIEIKARKLMRSRTSRKIGGICGGIAEMFRIDPTIVRLVYLVATILTGILPLAIAYVIGCIIIPERLA